MGGDECSFQREEPVLADFVGWGECSDFAARSDRISSSAHSPTNLGWDLCSFFYKMEEKPNSITLG